MNFKYFSITEDRKKDKLRKIEEKNGQLFMNKQFEQLVDKRLTLPVTLYHL